MMRPYHYQENTIFKPRDIIKKKTTGWRDAEFHREYVVIDFAPDGINVEQLRSDGTLGQSYMIKDPISCEKIGRWDGQHTMFVTLDVPFDFFTSLGGKHQIYHIAMSAISIAVINKAANELSSDEAEWAKSNIVDTTTAAARCGVDASAIRRACSQGEIVNAWKPSPTSRVWLMFWDDVQAWRKTRRKYTRK
jgi:hypothetical protein